MTQKKETVSRRQAQFRKRLGLLRVWLARPVDAAPLAYFRFVFGAIMVWEVYRYWSKGWIDRYYVEPQLFFTYPGFGWVSPWPEPWMEVHFAILAVLAAAIALGLAYRIAAPLFALGFWYVFLLDQSNYLNHFYLIALVATILSFLPAERYASLDAILRPELRRRWVPSWTLWVIRFQLGVAYIYGGLAKINADWLAGRPMDDWLQGSSDIWLVGPYLELPIAALLLSWGGLAFDLLVVPALVYRRTRGVAVVAVAVFHLMNSQIFSIGIFPWFMLAATPVFFGTPWGSGHRVKAVREKIASGACVSIAFSRLASGLLGTYVVIQLLVPFRHLAYPGNVSWTEEGHLFSWHMKLRDKSGRIEFTAHDPKTGRRWAFDHRDFLSARQARKMTVRPNLIAQFARKAKPRLEASLGVTGLEIRGSAMVSLNGRDRRPMIDPDVDLASATWGWKPADWIRPLEGESFAQGGGRSVHVGARSDDR